MVLKYVPESHKSTYLKEQIQNIPQDYNLTEKVVAVCSDSARNIHNTIENLMEKILYVPCF